jgi:hypothetical protein
MPSRSRFKSSLAVLAATFLAIPTFAFDTPLSEQAIREAYFLGQRGDESMVRLLAKYTKVLPVPRSGPHIASVTFFTPFALAVQSSSQHGAGYSAQQAQIDHRSQGEFVRVVVQIELTPSYGALIPAPTGSRSGSPTGYVVRPYDFWRDFDVRIFSPALRVDSNEEGPQPLRPFSSHGEPDVFCGERGRCELTGATLYFDLLATSFDSGDATIEVFPPEGDPLAVDFDLSTLR